MTNDASDYQLWAANTLAAIMSSLLNFTLHKAIYANFLFDKFIAGVSKKKVITLKFIKPISFLSRDSCLLLTLSLLPLLFA